MKTVHYNWPAFVPLFVVSDAVLYRAVFSPLLAFLKRLKMEFLPAKWRNAAAECRLLFSGNLWTGMLDSNCTSFMQQNYFFFVWFSFIYHRHALLVNALCPMQHPSPFWNVFTWMAIWSDRDVNIFAYFVIYLLLYVMYVLYMCYQRCNLCLTYNWRQTRKAQHFQVGPLSCCCELL